MAAKPIKSLELYYIMIQFLINSDIPEACVDRQALSLMKASMPVTKMLQLQVNLP